MNNDLGAEIEQRIKRQQEETLNLHKKALNDRFQKKKAELEKNYTEKAKLLEKQYSGSKRLMQALRVVAIISVLAIIVAIGAISQNRAIKKAEMLQDQIQEVNTADWYLCEKDMMVYTRLEEIYNDSAQKTLAVRENVRGMNAPITNNATIIPTGFSSGIVGNSTSLVSK